MSRSPKYGRCVEIKAVEIDGVKGGDIMTIKELSKNAYDELITIRDTMQISADKSQNEVWKFYMQGKIDGVNMVLNMMSDVDDDDYQDSRDPDNVFSTLKVGSIHFTIQVNESNVNAVVETLIDNKCRVVIKNIYEISENMTTWEIEYWKE